MHMILHLLLSLSVLLITVGIYHRYKPLPVGISFEGQVRPVAGLRFFADLTCVDRNGDLRCDQEIFDEIFRIITSAQEFILLDMFLYNEFLGGAQDGVPGGVRPLARQLTDLLVERQERNPAMEIIVITDPINTVYGSLEAPHLARLREAGVAVVVTDLDSLRDSNPLYSVFWRFFLSPFGDGPGRAVCNPFGLGRISIRSYLRMLNFKANHRKVLVADQGESFVGLVTSANPHDGSSGHTNIAVSFSGPAVADLLESEKAVLALSGARPPMARKLATVESPACRVGVTLQLLTEGCIRQAALTLMNGVGSGDSVDLVMFYLADRLVVRSILEAHRRGVRLRILLDPNKDAFGRAKNGIPNRQVARELSAAGVEIRWYDSHGEQCHAKMLLARHQDGNSSVIMGSANFTRRNLGDFNLETDVLVAGPSSAPFFMEATDFFDLLWMNEPDRMFSADYHLFAEDSFCKEKICRLMEASGMCTF